MRYIDWSSLMSHFWLSDEQRYIWWNIYLIWSTHGLIVFCLATVIALVYTHIYICLRFHYNDVIKGAMASQITSLTIVCSNVCSGADQRKYQSSASLAFVWGIHQWPVNFPNKWPVTRKMFPFDDVIMCFPGTGETCYSAREMILNDMIFFDGTGTKPQESALWPLLLTWFNFNPSMDK